MTEITVYDVTFLNGPAAGPAHRMIAAPETWIAWTHRQAIGVVQISNDPHQTDFWEPHDYRRVTLTPVTASYVLASTPDCLVDGDEWTYVDNCHDSTHAHFWFPANWPGHRAPARWEWSPPRNPEDTFDNGHTAVSVWVGDGSDDLWWTSLSASNLDDHRGGAPSVKNIRQWIQLERELLAERDPELDARDALAEVQAMFGVMPG